MREILFKGFHRCEDGKEKIFLNGEWIKGQWVEGYYITDTSMSDINAQIIQQPSCGLSMCLDENLGNLAVDVIPETVSQFTGMIDRKGVKIFENDVVEGDFWHCTKNIVRWGTGMYEVGGMSICTYNCRMTVNGTIFDNTDYLKTMGILEDSQ